MARWHAKIPDIIDPPDNVCYVVEIPNHPDYIAAFHGAYEQLSHWWAWQRDELKQGKDAAARWRLAVDETWTNIETWGDMCALTITVNCGSNCGCDYTYSPDATYDQITPEMAEQILGLDTTLVDDGVNPPSADYVDYQDYVDYKCAAAIRLADDLLDTFNRLGNLGATLLTLSVTGATAFITSTLTTGIVGALSAFLTPFGAVAFILALIVATFAISLRYLYIFYQIRQSMSRDDLICILFTAENPQAARSSFIEEVRTHYGSVLWDDVDQTLFDDFLLNFLDYLAPDELWAILFDRVVGYDTGTGFDCSTCIPTVPEGLTIESGTIEADGGDWYTITCGPSPVNDGKGTEYHEAKFGVDMDWVSGTPTSDRHMTVHEVDPSYDPSWTQMVTTSQNDCNTTKSSRTQLSGPISESGLPWQGQVAVLLRQSYDISAPTPPPVIRLRITLYDCV